MFPAEVYIERRQRLKTDIESGLILFPGNGESPANAATTAIFSGRTVLFLYFWGIDLPNMAAAIDVDADSETVFGDDPSLEDLIWTGPQLPLAERLQSGWVSGRQPPLGNCRRWLLRR